MPSPDINKTIQNKSPFGSEKEKKTKKYNQLKSISLGEFQISKEEKKIEKEKDRNRIKELENEMKIAKEFIAQSRSKGRSIRISGTLEITYEG